MKLTAFIHRWRTPDIFGPMLYDCRIYYGICLGWVTLGFERWAKDSDFEVRM